MMVIFVPKVVSAQLHALEDDCMISWLGKNKFVELSIHDTTLNMIFSVRYTKYECIH